MIPGTRVHPNCFHVDIATCRVHTNNELFQQIKSAKAQLTPGFAIPKSDTEVTLFPSSRVSGHVRAMKEVL